MHDEGGQGADVRHGERVPLLLKVTVAGRDYTAHPDDGAVTIGRKLPEDSPLLPARIQVDDPRISRIHIRIDQTDDTWWLTDPGSFNGTFIDGHQVESVPVDGALTLNLGNANGVGVQLNTTTTERSDEFRTADESLDQQTDTTETTTPVPEDDSTEALSATVQTAVTIDDAQITLRRIRTTTLPPTSDPDFHPRVNTLLKKLSWHDNTLTAHLSRAPGRPEVAVVLSDVRLAYADLLRKAASAPGATLGQRIYAARNAARLTVQEIATAAAVQIDDVTNAEAERPVAEATEAALQEVVDALTHHRLLR